MMVNHYNSQWLTTTIHHGYNHQPHGTTQEFDQAVSRWWRAQLLVHVAGLPADLVQHRRWSSDHQHDQQRPASVVDNQMMVMSLATITIAINHELIWLIQSVVD